MRIVWKDLLFAMFIGASVMAAQPALAGDPLQRLSVHDNWIVLREGGWNGHTASYFTGSRSVRPQGVLSQEPGLGLIYSCVGPAFIFVTMQSRFVTENTGMIKLQFDNASERRLPYRPTSSRHDALYFDISGSDGRTIRAALDEAHALVFEVRLAPEGRAQKFLFSLVGFRTAARECTRRTNAEADMVAGSRAGSLPPARR